MRIKNKLRTPLSETDVIANLISWIDNGHKAALATVISTWGSSPCPPGSPLAIRDDGAIVGSVSAGCVESAVINEAMKAIKGAPPQVCEYGVSGELAWEVGLACGGEIKILIRSINDSLDFRRESQMRARDGLSSCLVTRVSDATSILIGKGIKNKKSEVSDELRELAFKAINENQSFVSLIGKQKFFIESITPPHSLIIIGAVHIAQALAPMAKIIGFHVVVIDPRKSFATSERFPGIEIRDDWPDKAIADLSINNKTAFVLLTHDPKIDDQVLRFALESQAFYVGALGSSRTNKKRLKRLKEMGLNKNVLKLLHGPIGLNIGSKLPAEIAISILAEVIQKIRR